jgi:hypothetical protein
MTHQTITIDDLQSAADQLREYAKRIDDILEAATKSEISPRTATSNLNYVLCSVEDYAQMKQTPIDQIPHT